MALKAGRPTGSTEARIDHLKQQLADDDEEMRLNVRMSKREYQRLKQFALNKGMNISDVVRAALKRYVNE